MLENGDGDTLVTEESRYRLLIDAITDYAIYMLDPIGNIVSWNPGAERFKGYVRDEIIGQHFSNFYTEEDKAIGLPARALARARTEGRFEGEGWRVRKDGSRFWAFVVIDPILSPSGTLLGFAKITRDLTERKIAEDALRRSEEQFRRLVQGVTDYAIYMLDVTGAVTNWNVGAERIKGYAPSEIIGEHFSRFYTPEDRERGLPQRGLATATREGRFENEGWRLRKDGSQFWAHVIIDAIRDEQGVLVGFAKITRDITERRQAQQALEQAREALFQAQKMEAVGRLTGGVAHDFNNLLMAVMGSLEMLRKRLPADAKTLALLNNAVQGAERGAALTQRMLAFARKQHVNPSSVDLLVLVKGMSGLLQHSLGPTVRIETRFPLALPAAYADPNQLESALLNLAVNARDAMPNGGPLAISAFEEEVAEGHRTRLPPGSYVCLSVTDAGEGMDADTLERATEPFFTTKEVGKGTGLGLSVVHGLAEQAGGRLVLKSNKGEGTTAEIWLPVASLPRPELSVAAPGVGVENVVQMAGRDLVIVAVDDDALVLTNTTAMLEDLGCTVLSASSARQALEIMRQAEKIDLIITDHAMPNMTGIELVLAVRNERPNVPVVIVTGFAELPANVEVPVLLKPFRQKDLLRVIEESLAVA